MDLLTWTLVLLVFVFAYYHFKRKLDYFKDRGIPYLPGWPVFGNMAGLFTLRSNLWSLVQDLYKVNPDAKYVGGFDFSEPLVVMRDPEIIKSITIKNFVNFQDRRPLIDASIDPLFSGNLFRMTGEKWNETRALLSPAFTLSKMKGMYELIAECANNLVNYLEQLPSSKRVNVATRDVFTRITNDVIATCAFGISVDSLKDRENEFYTNGSQAKNFNGRAMIKFFIIRAFPALAKLLNLTVLSDRVASFFKKIVEETVNTRTNKGIHRPDMMQLMMDASKENGKVKMDITDMTAQAFLFFLGGFETTSTQLCLIAHELAINPDVQKIDWGPETKIISDSKMSATQTAYL